MERNTLVLILAVVLCLGWMAAGVARRYFQGRERMQLRQMLHEERLRALEAGQPAPDALEEPWLEIEEPWQPERLRLVALCLGLFLLFAGLGIWGGFALATEERLTQAATIGLVPVMAGIGLLLFHRLTRV